MFAQPSALRPPLSSLYLGPLVRSLAINQVRYCPLFKLLSCLSLAPRKATTLRRVARLEMAALSRSLPLVWIDCEMTGLDPDTDLIIEIFCIITNGALDVVDEQGWGTTIHQTKERMDMMDDWCTKTHMDSGLTAAVLASNTSPQQAADDLLEYIKTYVPESKRALLAGNSVHADKAFLRKEPYRKVMDHLHHRILDVSTIKEAAIRWSSPDVLTRVPVKKGLHQAKEDILESIDEAKYYKETIFKRSIEKKPKTE